MTRLGAILRPSFDVGQNRRAAVLAVLYAGIIAISFYLAYELRFDFLVDSGFQADRLVFLPFVVGLKLVALIAARQLGSMMTYFSIPDFFRLNWAMIGSTGVLFVFRLAGMGPPRGVLLIDFMLCTGALCLGRLATRLFRERIAGTRKSSTGVVQQQRIAIMGAGDAGASLAKEFLTNPNRGFRPVAFFDDDVAKHGKLVHGIPVLGAPEVIRGIKQLSVTKVVIAMPSAPAKRVREVVQIMSERGLKVETLPSMADLAAGRVKASRIRPVEVQDLLGREEAELDSEGIRRSIQGRVVLVTGAGGSIGSELCRQIAALAPRRLLLVEQCEGALFVIEQELIELGHGTLIVPLVGDILDEERMRFIFSHYEPEVVFHAAAHKHVFMMERQPAEAIRNNVLGTRLLAEVARDSGVDRFVLISTDKAINPTNVMGCTKRLAELQLMAIAGTQERRLEARGERREAEIGSRREARGERREAEVGGQRSEAGGRTAEVGSRRTEAGGQRAEAGGSAKAERPTSNIEHPTSNGENFEAGGEQKVRKAVDDRREARGERLEAGSQRAEGGSRRPEAGGESINDGGSQPSSLNSQLAAAPVHHPAAPAALNAAKAIITTVAKHATAQPSLSEVHKFRRGRPTKFMAVRFGNVLGSSGSVIPIFKRQIANGGPVTVTHPEVTRYFMTIPEAVGLVLQTSILGEGGEIFVLDMGQPVKIVDLAKQMIELSGFKVGEDIEIRFTGLKPGEKLYEELQHKTEHYSPTAHPRIMRFTTSAMFSESGVQELRQRLYELDSVQLKALLKRLVPEYTPHVD